MKLRSNFKHLWQCVATLLTIILVTGSCNHDESQAPAKGKLAFSLSSTQGYSTTGRVKSESLDAASITIERGPGEVVFDGVVQLTAFGDGYMSEQLELETGEFNLTKFILMEQGKANYATPLTGSEKASLVKHPLPIHFSIGNGVVTQVVPEVIAIGSDTNPAQFGYVQFGFEIVDDTTKAVRSFLVSTSIAAPGAAGQPVNGTLEVQAKNSSGDIIWSSIIAIDKTRQIHVPDSYRYAFTLSKPGYVPHRQFYRSTELEGADQLHFELIPEGSTDFITKNLFDGKITLYLPADRTKLYSRMDIAEGFTYTYLYTDRTANSAIGDAALAKLYFTEILESREFVRRAINLFDNVPFAETAGLRDSVDMSLSNYTTDFDRDVIVSSFTYAGGADGSFDTDFFEWSFDQHACYQYWCSATQNEYICKTANAVVSGRQSSSELQHTVQARKAEKHR